MEQVATVLVIDDDQDIGNMIRMILEFKGYTVYVLANADYINETMQNNSIDVVILDMFLCGTNGTDICIELKKDASLAHIPLIMMSAHPDAASLCMKAGADDFVSKPFDLDDLLLKIAYFTGTKTLSE